MRIISQDGMIDIPYEQAVININYINKNNIVADGVNCVGSIPYLIAKYSTEAKAQKAMDMLRKRYSENEMIKVLACGTCEYMDKSLESNEKRAIYEDYCNKNIYQFPADEELGGG